MAKVDHLKRLGERYPSLAGICGDVQASYGVLYHAYKNNGKLLVCGNGGSASDAEHIVGELMKGFNLPRVLAAKEREALGGLGDFLQGALPTIALTGHPALSTAFLNDVEPKMVFAQQVYGYGQEGDVLLALTTSGNSENVINAAKVARHKGMKVVGMTGHDGGKLKTLCDVCIIVPGETTADIQEYHLPVYHTLCAMLEETFFGEA